MLEQIKGNLKRLINTLGWDVRRYTLASNPMGQILAAIDKVQVDTVFDVGANIGQFAQELRSVGFSGSIVSFEPLSEAHARLTATSAGDLAWKVHPRTAVGDHDGDIEINIAKNSASSSVLSMLETHLSAAPDSAFISSERAPLVRLDSIARRYLIESSRYFIKIDTQGFEWQVLDGAVDMIKDAQGVLLELSLVPLYDGQKLWLEMIQRMERMGFNLWAIQKGLSDPQTGRTLQVDAVFLRT
ncbi:MAG: FkbM family methyltransferase [Rhodobacteraceae bacterium]|nr:FkbM family methyltransferase [Paracoccaceae bacterium]